MSRAVANVVAHTSGRTSAKATYGKGARPRDCNIVSPEMTCDCVPSPSPFDARGLLLRGWDCESIPEISVARTGVRSRFAGAVIFDRPRSDAGGGANPHDRHRSADRHPNP